jgi:lipopolysaccharide export system protein LptA
MRKIQSFIFAVIMVLSLTFIGNVVSSNAGTSVKAQTVSVKRKRKPGIIRGTARGAKYIGKKTYQGTKYVGKKTYQGAKFVGKKTVKGTRATVSRAKKIIY